MRDTRSRPDAPDRGSQEPGTYMLYSNWDFNADGAVFEQLVSPAWARKIVSVVTPLEEMNPVERRDGYFGNGYMWWIFDGPRAVGPFEGAYTARGAWGQWITVFPAIDVVLAHKTNSAYGRTTSWASWHRMIELLLDAKGVEMPGPYPWAETPSSP